MGRIRPRRLPFFWPLERQLRGGGASILCSMERIFYKKKLFVERQVSVLRRARSTSATHDGERKQAFARRRHTGIQRCRKISRSLCQKEGPTISPKYTNGS